MLIVCDVVPGERSAGEVRLARMATLWAETCNVTLVSVDHHLDERDDARTRLLEAAGVDVLDLVGPTTLRTALAMRVFDLVLVEFWHVAERAIPLVRNKQPWATVIVDTVDLHFLREERGAALGRGSTAGLEDRRRRELAVYRAADARIFVSSEERRHYRDVTQSHGRDVVVSLVVRAGMRSPGPRAQVVAFVANFWHAPNVDALAWFSQEIWPVVRSSHPTATFVVAGSRVGKEIEEIGRADGIEIRGFVDDIDAFYDEASVVVAPLRFGAGVKGKVAEALAASAPLVATKLATEGLDLKDDVELAVADTADTFATQVCRLLDDPAAAARLGSIGRDSILSQCGPSAARQSLESLSERTMVASVRPGLLWRLLGIPVRARQRTRSAAGRAARLIQGTVDRSSGLRRHRHR